MPKNHIHKNKNRRPILPLAQLLEPRTLFSVTYSNADLNGVWALNAMDSQGSVAFNGGGTIFGGQVVTSSGDVVTPSGTYSISPSGGVTLSLPGLTLAGGMNASKNLAAARDLASKNISIITQSGTGPFASSDLDGAWYIFYNGKKNPNSTDLPKNSGFGTIGISSGELVGTISDDATETTQQITGTSTIGQGGDVTLNINGDQLPFVGELTSTKDVAILSPSDLASAASSNATQLLVMIKINENATFTNASLTGTWRLVSDSTTGTITFDGAGHLAGSVVSSDGTSAVTGQYNVASTGFFAAVIQAGTQSINFTGMVNASDDVIAMDQPNSGDNGVDDLVLLVNSDNMAVTPPVGNPRPTPITLTSGSLNPNFGDNGVATTNISGPPFTIVDSVVQPDGKIVQVGQQVGSGLVLLRFNPDGTPDTSFGDGSGVFRFIGTADHPTSLALQSDGKILVAGSIDGNFELLRFTTSGTPDNSFANGGLVTTDFGGTDGASAIAVGPDGKIYLAGSTDASNAGDFAVARYNSDGSLDFSKTFDFSAGNDVARTVTITSDGRAVIAGSATVNGAVDAAAIRLLTNGQLDNSFATGGKFTLANGTDTEISASAISSDGKIVFGGFTAHGTLGSSDFGTNFFLTRLLTNGKLDPKFATKGIASTAIPNHPLAAINNLVITTDGSILVAGKTASALGDADANQLGVAIAKYTSTGALDTSFNNTGILLLFQPTVSQSQAPAAPGDLVSQFNDFTNTSVGLVDLTQGGGILALASTPDSSSNSTTVSIAEIVPSGADLTAQSLVLSKVPSSVLGGAKGSATLTITNTGSAAIKESVPLTIYLSSDPSYFGQSITTSNLLLNLKPHASRKINLKFLFPSNVSDGAYYVVAGLANTNDINATNDSAATNSATTVAHPFVDLATTFLTQPPSSLSATGKDPVTLLITNNGNVTAKGASEIQLLLSADDALGDDTALADLTKKLSIAPGKSLKLKLNFTPGVTSGTADFLAAIVSFNATPADSDPSNNTVFSDSAITFN